MLFPIKINPIMIFIFGLILAVNNSCSKDSISGLSICEQNPNAVAQITEADIVFKTGSIYTVDSDKSTAEALAVKDKKIIYIGSDADVEDYIGSNTKVYCLDGKTVLPAFFDTHMHPVWGALGGTDDEPMTHSKEEVKNAIMTLNDWLNTLGITTIHDANLSINEPNVYEAYSELAEAGLMTVRYRASWASGVDVTETTETINAGIQLAGQFNHSHFKAQSFKIFADGLLEGHDALLMEPYDDDPDYYGLKRYSDADMVAAFEQIDQAGYQIYVHTIGDSAVNYTLDALEAAGITFDDRASFSHVQLATQADVTRMGQLGMGAHMSPYWHVKDDDVNTQNYLGSDRANNQQYPHKSLFDAGVFVTCASDYSVSQPDPGLAIFRGMTRKENTSADALGPSNEKVSLEEMIESMTINGAYSNFLESDLGSIEVGKLADITVIDRDLFATAVENIKDLNVLMTLFEGEIVFKR